MVNFGYGLCSLVGCRTFSFSLLTSKLLRAQKFRYSRIQFSVSCVQLVIYKEPVCSGIFLEVYLSEFFVSFRQLYQEGELVVDI